MSKMSDISLCVEESSTVEEFIKRVKETTGMELSPNTTLFCKNKFTLGDTKSWEEML